MVGLGILRGKDIAGTTRTTTSATGRRSIVARSRNPIAKLLDGAEERGGEHGSVDVFPEEALGREGKEKEGEERLASPIPLRWFSPDSPFASRRRRGIYSISEKSGEDGDAFVERVSSPAPGGDVQMRLSSCGADDAVERVDEAVGGITFQALVWQKQREQKQTLRANSDVAPDE